jgi:hypothetical protein
MGKISTGYWPADFAMCLMLPVLLKYASLWLGVLSNAVWSWTRARLKVCSGEVCVRSIRYEVAGSGYPTAGRSCAQNIVLQRAILIYIDGLQQVTRGFPSARVLLQDPLEGLRYNTMSASHDTVAAKLEGYGVITTPPMGLWVDVIYAPRGRVAVRVTETSEGAGVDRAIVVNLEVMATASANEAKGTAETLVSEFVNGSYRAYIDGVRRNVDPGRYLYQPQPLGVKIAASPGQPGQSGQLYKRYPLSEDKTFATGFFHPDKVAIMALVDNFTRGTGKFAVSGYPQKLGFLLHGPPGTGKTTFIKALAQYTGRHIVSVPLAKVTTNQELMDIMFDRQFNLPGQVVTAQIPFSKIIFVMEDIDAASDAVLSRAACQGGGGKSTEDPDETRVEGPCMERKYKFEIPDRLNLAGLLNVLDGVLDCPGRVVVMTTNHPEMLDAALVRPGRVNRRVFMGPLRAEEAMQMAEQYFGKLGHAERRAFKAAVTATRDITPAALEMLCGEYESIDDLTALLVAGAALH